MDMNEYDNEMINDGGIATMLDVQRHVLGQDKLEPKGEDSRSKSAYTLWGIDFTPSSSSLTHPQH